MKLLKVGLDSWGTTGRQNTTGLLLEAHKLPKKDIRTPVKLDCYVIWIKKRGKD